MKKILENVRTYTAEVIDALNTRDVFTRDYLNREDKWEIIEGAVRRLTETKVLVLSGEYDDVSISDAIQSFRNSIKSFNWEMSQITLKKLDKDLGHFYKENQLEKILKNLIITIQEQRQYQY